MANLQSSAALSSAARASGNVQSRFKLVAAASVGNGLEIFDFTIYSFFAGLIGKLFFASNSASGSLLLAVATFGVGFVVRPLGGVLIGRYADRRGRKPAMTLSIGMMAIGTALIGLSPTYRQIGMFAPLIVITGRLLQGFSAGGEVGAATTYLMEAATPGSRAFLVSWQMAGQGAAALLGALSGYILAHSLSTANFETWGWRLPFLLGLLIGPVGLFIRNRLNETHVATSVPRDSLREALSVFRNKIIVGVFTIFGGTASIYIVIFYMPTYLIRVRHMSTEIAYLAGAVSGAVLMVGSPLVGLICDRVRTRKSLVMTSTILGLISIYPAFWVLNHTENIALSICVIATLVVFITLGTGPTLVLLMEAFPRRVRATGLAVVYSIGVSIFGGLAQLIVTWLINSTANPLSPAWYMIACGGATLIALFIFREGHIEDE